MRALSGDFGAYQPITGPSPFYPNPLGGQVLFDPLTGTYLESGTGKTWVDPNYVIPSPISSPSLFSILKSIPLPPAAAQVVSDVQAKMPAAPAPAVQASPPPAPCSPQCYLALGVGALLLYSLIFRKGRS